MLSAITANDTSLVTTLLVKSATCTHSPCKTVKVKSSSFTLFCYTNFYSLIHARHVITRYKKYFGLRQKKPFASSIFILCFFSYWPEKYISLFHFHFLHSDLVFSVFAMHEDIVKNHKSRTVTSGPIGYNFSSFTTTPPSYFYVCYHYNMLV